MRFRDALVLFFLVTSIFLASCGTDSDEEPDGDTDRSEAILPDGDYQPPADQDDIPSDGDEDLDLVENENAEDEETDPTVCSKSCIELPETLNFDPPAPGETSSKELIISSVGSEALKIIDAYISVGEEEGFTIHNFLPAQPPVDIDPTKRMIIQIDYQTDDISDHQAVLTIISNDDLQNRHDVRLKSEQPGYADLTVSPESLAWSGEVIGSLSEIKILTLSATSETEDSGAILEVTDLDFLLGAASPFSLAFLESDQCHPPFFLAVGEQVECGVHFLPQSAGITTDTLRISASSNGLEQQVDVSLVGTGLFVSYAIDPETIQFGNVLVSSGAAVKTLLVENTGTADLVIPTLQIIGSPNFAYGDPDGVINHPIPPLQTATFNIFYMPLLLAEDEAILQIASNAGDLPTLEIPISGKGILQCPPGLMPGEGDLSMYCLCEPGAIYCEPENSPNYRQCADDGITVTELRQCPGGALCINGQCESISCEPRTSTCADDTHTITCKVDGSGYGDPVVCPSGPDCNPFLCQSETGNCEQVDAPFGTLCDDSDPCTDNDICDGSGNCSGTEMACVDGNPCTDDLCDPQIGCYHLVKDGASCDDGNGCTVNDYCLGSNCVGGEGSIDCDDENDCTVDSCDPQHDPPCGHEIRTGACDDGNACTIGDQCVSGSCISGQTQLDCDDGEACTADNCNPDSGCVNSFQLGPCDDADPCTAGDQCGLDGTTIICVPGTRLNCDDDNDCTVDSCDGFGGCNHQNMTNVPCSDGNACTDNDLCQDGVCIPGPELVCDDGNFCTNDHCNTTSGCIYIRNTKECDDGNPCTIGDRCDLGECLPGTVTATCDDSNDCTYDFCTPEDGCQHLDEADGAECDDGNSCTSGDECLDGICTSGDEIICDDDDPCTVDSCDEEGGCIHSPLMGLPCDDHNPCTVGDYCGPAGQCTPGPEELECDDGNPCRAWQCDSSQGCRYSSRNGTCDDGNPCTLNDYCYDGECRPGNSPLLCNDSNSCTEDRCVPGLGCQYEQIEGSCDDSNPCTVGDFCAGGRCQPGATPLDCDDEEECTTDSCQVGVGCRHSSREGATCDDNNECTVGDRCVTGECVSGLESLNCNDNTPCTLDSCNPQTGCEYTIDNNAYCNDGNACTSNDHCYDGECIGEGVDCNDDNPCTLDLCDPDTQGCYYENNDIDCDDELFCTVNDHCVDRACIGDPRDCSEETTSCGQGKCDELMDSCYADSVPYDGDSCEDGDPCTFDDICIAGSCTGEVLDCSDYADMCNLPACNPDTRTCFKDPLPDSTACTPDANPCTDDHCIAGACSHPKSANGSSCDNGAGVCSNGICISAFDLHYGDVLSIEPTRSGFVTGGADHMGILMRLEPTFIDFPLTGHYSSVRSVAAHPSQDIVATGSDYGRVRVWTYTESNATSIQTIIGAHTGSVRDMAFSADGSRFFTCGDDSLIIARETTNYTPILTIPLPEDLASGHRHDGSVRAIAISPDGSMIASAGYDRTIRLWSADSGLWIRDMGGHGDMVNALAFDSVSGNLASGDEDGNILFWDVATGTQSGSIPNAHGSARVTGLVYNADGTQLISSGYNRKVVWWNIATYTEDDSTPFSCYPNDVTRLSMSDTIATACSNGIVYVSSLTP